MKLNIKEDNKYNHYNIITDNDINITDEQHVGESLAEVINTHDKKIERLESNVKWMYRYGALGSGGSGGSGGSDGTSTVSVRISKDGRPLSPKTKLMLSGDGYYKFKIILYGGKTDTFDVACTSYQNNGYQTNYYKLTPNNGFTVEPSILLTGNHELTIEVISQTTHMPCVDPIVFPYVTSSYTLTAYYVKGKDYTTTQTLDAYTIANHTIFMSNIASTGIMLALKYNIAVDIMSDATEIEYNDWEDRNISIKNNIMYITYLDGQTVKRPFDIRIASNSSGVVYLPLAEKIVNENEEDTGGFLNDNDNAAFKQVTVTVTSQMYGDTNSIVLGEFNFNDNLIPRGLFLNVKTDEGRLYKSIDSAKTAQPKHKMTVGDIVFSVTPYNGPLNTLRPYSLKIYLYDIDVDNNEETEIPLNISLPSLTDQKTTDITIPCSDPGIKRIKFVLTSTGSTFELSYYINVKSFTTIFDWYSVNPSYSTYFKRNEGINNMEGINLSLSKDLNIQMTANDYVKRIKLFDFEQDGYDNIVPSLYDILLGIGIQYYSINDTSKPILSFDVSGSTATEKKPYSIFLFQDKLAIMSSTVNVDNNGNISSYSSLNAGIFIPLEDDYEPTNAKKYHLFNVYKRLENKDNAGYPYRSIGSYIDGVLEGLLSKFESEPIIFESLTLYPGNYSINLLEYSLFSHSQLTLGPNDSVTWLEDIDIDRYNKAYVEKIMYRDSYYSIDEKALFEEFNNFTYDSKNRICVQNGSAARIASYAKCPVLVLNFADSQGGEIKSFNKINNDNFLDWFEESIGENMQDLVKDVPVTLQYSDGKSGVLETIKMHESDENAVFFYLDRQGSSTKTFRCKNLELHGPKSSDSSKSYVFSPNMMINPNSPGYNESFLPEESFTLKADVVDSSHTNNNAIGKFVNDNTTPFSGARSNSYQHGTRFNVNIKNALIGFPVLVFLNTSWPDIDSSGQAIGTRTTKHYFLGIYNFNLGRNSAFNLGYKDIKIIENAVDSLGDNAKDGFVIYEIPSDENLQMPILAGGEIQGNNPHYDFSQYNDNTILFGKDDPLNPIEGMWGDLIGDKNHIENVKQSIKNLCEETAFAGGFAFTLVGKQMSEEKPTNEDGTINPNYERFGYDASYSKVTTKIVNGVEKNVEWVPNYHWQATREQNETTVNYIYNRIDSNGTLESLKRLILAHEKDNDEYNIPRVDYISLSEYYTTMMGFGLVDSPMKNLNVKSWNSGDTFYLAFYDMDTGLGKNNAGTYINYFAFSDYWKSVYEQTKTPNIYNLNQVNIIRDYSPKIAKNNMENSAFFDVPSTYLFAVAKYAKSIFRRTAGDNFITNQEYATIRNYDPSNIWGKWRKNVWTTKIDEETGKETLEYHGNDRGEGCLQNANLFMKRYFNHHLENIPQEAFNFNYRYKYLVKESDNLGFDGVNFIKFHGRGIAYTTYWLDGRLHILDAYFNINGIDDDISIYNGEPIKASFTEQLYRPTDNPDVYMLQDAFVGENGYAQYPETHDVMHISAKSFAPFILEYTQSKQRYLFPEDPKTMEIPLSFTGNITIGFFGSKMWTSIGELSTFIKQNNSFSINSKYITSLNGSSRACNSWTFNTPALRTLRLTSEDYEGNINNFVSQPNKPIYQNLDEINISGTKIKLNIEYIPLRKLYATDMKQGAQIIGKGLNKLEDVRISGEFEIITLNSWSDSIAFPTSGKCSARNMSITNDIERFPECTISISNNATLEELTLSGFAHIYINECPNLKVINTDTVDVIKTLVVNMPKFNSETSLKIVSTPDSIADIINLTNFVNIEKIGFENTTIKRILLPGETSTIDENNKRNIKLNIRALSGCKNFENFENEKYNNLYITGEGTFNGCGTSVEDGNGYRLIKNEYNKTMTSGNISEAISNIYVDESCTSLKNTFNGIGKINYIIASEFLKTRCTDSSVSNVTNIDNMFKGNIIEYKYNTYYTEYLGRKPVNGDSIDPYCSLPLWGFENCVSATDVFSDNDIDFFNRYMFEKYKSDHSGKKLFDCLDHITLGTICNTFSIGTIDMLYPFMNKLVSIDFKQQTIITIYNPDPTSSRKQYNTYDTLYVNDLFVHHETIDENTTYDISPRNLSLLRNFTISSLKKDSPYGSLNAQKFSFEGLFDNDKNSVSEYEWQYAYTDSLTLQNFMATTYSIEYYEKSYVNVLFSKIVPLYIVNSFTGFNITNTEHANDKLNIYTMFNWDLVQTRTTNLFCDSYAGTSNMSIGGINVNKQCTYNDFHTIWSKLLASTKLKSVTALFTDCTIINDAWVDDDDNVYEFTLLANGTDPIVNDSITTVPQLFKNLKLTDNDEIYYPINITSSIFRCMKSIVYVQSIFENTYMSHAIPFDVFGKREQSNTYTPCKIKKSTSDDSVDYVEGKIVSFVYNKTIQNMNRAFYNITFPKKEDATFRNAPYNKYELNYATININNDSTRYYDYYIKVNGVLVKENQPSEIVDMQKLWIDLPDNDTTNNLIKTTEKTNESLIPNVYRGPIIGEFDENKGKMDYTVNDYSSNDKVYINLSNFCSQNDAGFVVSPDIFRCCANGCDIKQSIRYDRSSSQKDPVIMTGMMPPSIFDGENLMNMDFSGVFTGLNVVPIELPYNDIDDIKVADMHNSGEVEDVSNLKTCKRHNTYYQYILSNFTNRTIISECFNFMLLLPSSKSIITTEKNDNQIMNQWESERFSQHFIMFGENSFSDLLNKYEKSFPVDYAGILEDKNPEQMHVFYEADNGIYFNITRKFYEFTDANTRVEYITGIDKTIFKNFMYDNLVSSDIAKILEGYVMSINNSWTHKNVTDYTSSVVFYQVAGNDTGYTGLSSNARIQASWQNYGWFPKTGINYKISMSSLPKLFDYTRWRDNWNGYVAVKLNYV